MCGVSSRRGTSPVSLANLRQNRPELTHGVYRIKVGQPETQELAGKLMAVLEGDDASIIKPADAAACSILAVLLRRLQAADQYLDENGLVDAKGQVRPIMPVVVSMSNTVLKYLESLGATPQSRARLGVNTGRALSLAQLMAEAEGAVIDAGGGEHSEQTSEQESNGHVDQVEE